MTLEENVKLLEDVKYHIDTLNTKQAFLIKQLITNKSIPLKDRLFYWTTYSNPKLLSTYDLKRLAPITYELMDTNLCTGEEYFIFDRYDGALLYDEITDPKLILMAEEMLKHNFNGFHNY